MSEVKKDIDLTIKKLGQTIRDFELEKISGKHFRDLVYGYSKYIKVLYKYGSIKSQNNFVDDNNIEHK